MTLMVPRTVGPQVATQYIRVPFKRPFTVPMILPPSVWNSAPEFLQTADVEIDQAVADGATAGDGDDGFAAAGEQGAEDADAAWYRLTMS